MPPLLSASIPYSKVVQVTLVSFCFQLLAFSSALKVLINIPTAASSSKVNKNTALPKAESHGASASSQLLKRHTGKSLLNQERHIYKKLRG